jgi:transposase
MAQLIRMGWFRPVHAKSPGSREVRALLVAPKQLQYKLTDIELSIRGIRRSFGLKVGKVTDKTFEARIRKLVSGHAMLEQVAEAMPAARPTLLEQFNKLHKAVLDIVRHDQVCRRFMTIPSVGAIVAITYKSALDDASRIKKSRNAGTALWIDAEEIPIGPDGRRGRHHARWPQDGAHGPLRGGERVALAGHAFLGAQALVTGGGQAPWSEARKGGRLVGI